MNSKLFTATVLRRTLGLLAMTVMVASCGTKTNPTDGYDLGGVPKDGHVNEAVGVQPGELFFVELTSMSDAPIAAMSFVEGKPASYKIKIHTVLSKASFHLTAPGLPAGVAMTQVDPSNPQSDYIIQGIVPVGTSPSSLRGTDSTVVITVAALSGDQKQIAILKASGTTYPVKLNVAPTDELPVVEPRAPLTVTEGDVASISLIVKDKGSHNAEMPVIQSPFQDEIQTAEVSIISAMAGLRMSRTGTPIGDNRFEFKGTLDTKQLVLPSGKKDVTARFVVNFKSPSQMISADEYVDVKIIRKVIAPVATPAPAPISTNAPAATNAPATVAPTQAPSNTNLEAASTNAPTNAPAANAKPAASNAKNTAPTNKPAASKNSKSSSNSKNSKNKKATSKKKSTPKGAQ